MRATFDSASGELRIVFAELDAAREFFEKITNESGFVTSLEVARRFRETLTVRVSSQGGFDVCFRAGVHGVAPSGERFMTTLLLEGWGLAERQTAKAALIDARNALAPPSAAESRPAEASAATLPASESRGVSPMHRVRAMNPNQRTMLARKADRVERQILLKDSSQQVLQALLANPRIEGKDVLRLVKSTHTAAPLLTRIAEDPRWGQNQEIVGAIARSPKTPTPVCLRLMDKLRTNDLQFMAKQGSGVRENIRRAALKEYMRRTGR